MRRIGAVALFILALSACAQFSLVEAKRQTIGDAFAVEAQIPWSKATSGKIEMWTVDGPSLEAVRFAKGLSDGERLFEPGAGQSKDDWPVYKTAMRANDIMDFVIDTLARGGMGEVDARNLRPADFGAAPGFRFELSFVSPDGLAYDGLAAGAVIGGKLQLVLYTGTRNYYFPKYRVPVERLIDSVQLI